MTLSALHAMLLAFTGLLLLITAVILMRRGLLAIRYGLGWALIGVVAITCSPAIALLEPVATALGLTVPGLAIAVAVTFLVLISLQLSISLSGMREQIRSLAELVALSDAHRRAMPPPATQAHLTRKDSCTCPD